MSFCVFIKIFMKLFLSFILYYIPLVIDFSAKWLGMLKIAYYLVILIHKHMNNTSSNTEINRQYH